MRWRDRDMWVDKRKDNSNCIRSPAALGTGNIAFPAEKNNMKTGPQRRGDSLLCLIRSCYSPLTHQDEYAAKQTPTTIQPHTCTCRNFQKLEKQKTETESIAMLTVLTGFTGHFKEVQYNEWFLKLRIICLSSVLEVIHWNHASLGSHYLIFLVSLWGRGLRASGISRNCTESRQGISSLRLPVPSSSDRLQSQKWVITSYICAFQLLFLPFRLIICQWLTILGFSYKKSFPFATHSAF